MGKAEFLKGCKILELCYDKVMNDDMKKIWYVHLQHLDAQIFYVGINNLIVTSKFFPKISEIIEECKIQGQKKYMKILDQMKKDNYFKDFSELEKATRWIETGRIPDWFVLEIKKYDVSQISSTEKNLLNGGMYNE